METQTHILGSQKKAAVSGSDAICCLSSSHNYNKEKSEAEISLEWKLIMIVFLPKRLKITHTKNISGQLAGQVAERQRPRGTFNALSTEAVCFISPSALSQMFILKSLRRKRTHRSQAMKSADETSRC